MAREYIITMTAANRVGILAAVTSALGELNCELRELSQTVVRRYFTMIFAAEFPDSVNAEIIRDHLTGVCRPFGIEISIKDPSLEKLPENSGDQPIRKKLKLSGDNRPGILRQVSALMSLRRVDIVRMHAKRSPDDARFEMYLHLELPSNLSPQELRREACEAGADWNVTAELQDAT